MLDPEELGQCLSWSRAFHLCYDRRYLHRKTGLVVWGKDWGIGVDDDPTTGGRPDDSCVNIFLNSFLYRDLQAAGELAGPAAWISRPGNMMHGLKKCGRRF